MKGLLIAIQFLTRIPVRVRGDLREQDIGRSAIFFPLVGLVQGIPAAGAAFVASLLFSPDIAAGVVVTLLIIINGGFHVDGLADTADGISVKGTGNARRDKEKRLAVMKDSSVGAMGALAIALLVLLKYLFISALLEKGSTWDVMCMVLLVPVFSKWIMVPVIYHGTSARPDGLGRIFIVHGGAKVLILSFTVLLVIFACASFLLPGTSWRSASMLFLLFALSSYVLGLLWTAFCTNKFGGLTGDTIGAVSEVADIVLFAIAFLWL